MMAFLIDTHRHLSTPQSLCHFLNLTANLRSYVEFGNFTVNAMGGWSEHPGWRAPRRGKK
jgi:hypothetical protein